MKQLVTIGIVLGRTDYGEADRILTLLTPDYGKLRLMARGVRRVKSKLAGGIELFSVSEISFIKGKGGIGTLTSSRLKTHFSNIVKDLNRTMLGYELLKQLNKTTEDEPEEAYFTLLAEAFEALNDPEIPLDIIRFWFDAQLLRVDGHEPNLQTDDQARRLSPEHSYAFDFEHMNFRPTGGQTSVSPSHIKFLRLGFEGQPPKALQRVQNSTELLKICAPLVRNMGAYHQNDGPRL